MAFWNKKKKKDDEAEEVVEQAPKRKQRPRKRKRGELLVSVVSETVTEQVLPDFQAIGPMTFHHDGRTWYCGLFLNADTVGGISKRVNRDEAKGAAIECIANRRIKVLATQPLLEDNCMIIVPDQDTLDTLSEFSFLDEATYQTAFISPDGSDIIGPDPDSDEDDGIVDITTDDVRDILKGGSIGAYLAEHGSSMGSDYVEAPAAPEPEPLENGSDLDEPDDDVDDLDEDEDIELAGEGPDTTRAMPAQETAPQAPEPPQAAPQAPAERQYESEKAANDDANIRQAAQSQTRVPPVEQRRPQQAPQPQPQPKPMVVENAEEQAKAIVKAFEISEVGIKLDMDRFDILFDRLRHAPGFSEKAVETEGYVGDYLTQMRRTANAALQRHRTESIDRIREQFIDSANGLINGINNRVAVVPDGTSYWSQRFTAIQRDADEARTHMEERVEDGRREIDRQYEAAVKRIADNAAARAGQEWRQRHAKEQLLEKTRVAERVRADIDAERLMRTDDMNAERREDAQRLFDIAIADLITRATDQWAVAQKEEDALFEQYRDKMAAWLDENRANDIAYADAIKAQLRDGGEAEKARKEAAAKIAEIRAEATAHAEELRRQQAEADEAHAKQLEDLKRSHELELKRLTSERDDMRSYQTDLQNQLQTAKEEAKKDVENEIKMLRNECEAHEREIEAIKKGDRHMLYMAVAIAIVVAVCMLCVGFIFGINNGAGLVSSMNGTVILL